MFEGELPGSDVLSAIVVHFVASTVTASSHQGVYFTLGVTFWAIHLAHYVFLASTLMLVKVCCCQVPKFLPLRKTLPLALSQALVSSATSCLHHSGSNGALYAQRVSDFSVTLIVIALTRLAPQFNYAAVKKRHVALLVFIGCTTSLCWLEGLINFSWSYPLIWPVLVIAYAFHILLVNKAFREKADDVDFHDLVLNVTTLTSVMLIPGGVIFQTDHVTKEWHNVSSAWEVSDYGMIAMCYASMTIMLYTKYWLMCMASVETYLATWHCKYLLASFGQMFFQMLTNVNALSGLSRILATGAMGRYILMRRDTKKESHLPNGSAY